MTTIFTYSYLSTPPDAASLTPYLNPTDTNYLTTTMSPYSFNAAFGRALSMWSSVADIHTKQQLMMMNGGGWHEDKIDSNFF